MSRGLAARVLRGLGGRRHAREPGRLNHVSLGSHCHMAHLLKGAGLRTWSGPFDWIFSNARMVRHCLADDFATLLDRSAYRSVPLPERLGPDVTRCRHRDYGEAYGLPVVFNHHDPAVSDEDYRFLQDGVRRLRTALANPEAENRLYLLATLPVAPEDAVAICDSLARYPSRNRLMVMQVEAGAAAPAAQRVGLGCAALAFHVIHTRSASLGLRFAEEADDAFLLRLIRSETWPDGNRCS
ncbi:DUF1796 family putative cysteine peptidase [Methylobacterium oryzisoli]|uniref:DUF1796 family putative cysteine peptidase n=1 Tax=Methylobacterium oryzisoli TaxID=3385502 RepID=UPI0038923542